MLQLMSPNSQQPVEDFLWQLDNNPRLLPRWPKSDRLVLVFVIAATADPDCVTPGYMIEDRQDIQKIWQRSALLDDRWRYLFFTVLKSRVASYAVPIESVPWETTVST